MNTYPSLAAYTADVEKSRAAYYADEAVRAGYCAACKRRKRDTNTRSRRCWTCRHDGIKETK